MCGIVEAVNWADASALETATNLQMHHGPDDVACRNTVLLTGRTLG